MANNIFIFSCPVRSGKTSALANFMLMNNCNGFLTPDRHDKRFLYVIAEDSFYEMEATGEYAGETLTIGRFVFRKDAFDKANKIMKDAGNKDWFIVDEAGPLEIIQHTGLEPGLSALISRYRDGKLKGKLLLVIRDKLLEQAQTKYGLANVVVVHSTDQL